MPEDKSKNPVVENKGLKKAPIARANGVLWIGSEQVLRPGMRCTVTQAVEKVIQSMANQKMTSVGIGLKVLGSRKKAPSADSIAKALKSINIIS